MSLIAGGSRAVALNDVKAEIDDLGNCRLIVDAREQQLGAFAPDLRARDLQRGDHRTDMAQQVDVIKARYRKLRWNGPAAALTLEKRADGHDVGGKENRFD